MGRAAKRKAKAQVRKHLLDVSTQESLSIQEMVKRVAMMASAQILKIHSTTERGVVLAHYQPQFKRLELDFLALDSFSELLPDEPQILDLVNQYDPQVDVVFGYLANDSNDSFIWFKLPIKLLMATALIIQSK